MQASASLSVSEDRKHQRPWRALCTKVRVCHHPVTVLTGGGDSFLPQGAGPPEC